MRAVLYLRRSTNEKLQADSLRVQEHILRAYARERDMEIVDVLSDSASGSTAVRRPGFMRLVGLVTSKPSFEAVLVRDVSRFGRFFDVDEGAYWDVLFRAHGVRTIYCEESFGESDTLMDSLTKSIRRVMASEYVRDRSRCVRYSQSRVVRLGFMHGGPPPYGMARMMVTLDGEAQQPLANGEWKALSNSRTKLTMGVPCEVETVQRVFRMYAFEGATLSAIAATLNNDGVQSPRGKQWSVSSIRGILSNPRYVGDLRYRTQRKTGPETMTNEALSALSTTTINCHPAIVERATWESAERRTRSATRNRGNENLARDLREAFERTGFLSPKLVDSFENRCSWSTFSHRFFRGHTEALELAYAEVLNARWQQMEELLRRADIRVVRTSQTLSLSELRVTIGLRLGIPTLSKHAPLIRFDTSRVTDDATVFVLMTPEGLDPYWFFFRRTDGLHPRAALLNRGSRRFREHRTDDEQLIQRVSCLRFASRDRMEDTFLAAARCQPRLNLSELARELDWSYGTVTRCYRALLARREWLPPLLKSPGRRIEFVCSNCAVRREMVPSDALALKSDMCASCQAEAARRIVVVRCPRCGRNRSMRPSAARRLSNGAETRCGRCNINWLAEKRREIGTGN